MPSGDQQTPGVTTLVGRLVETSLAMVRNRAELFALEWEEEMARLAELVVRMAAMLFLAMMGVLLLTALIILLFPSEYRLYAMAGFALLYLLGALAVGFTLKAALGRQPFAASLDQVRKDRLWLDSLR